jgi:hypothetical protein
VLIRTYPALRDIHKAPYYVAVLNNPPGLDASRLRRLESEQPHRVVVLGGLACGAARWRSRILNAIKQTIQYI